MGAAEDRERALRARRLEGLWPEAVAGRFVVPAYEGASLLNVPATLARLLGVEVSGLAGPLEADYWQGLGAPRRIVLVLVDALGYLPLQQVLAARPEGLLARLARDGRLLPMTSVAPSTTNTCLTSLLTGRGPAAHGVLGYELWLREWGVLAEMLSLKPAYGPDGVSLLDWGLDPEAFTGVPALGEILTERGVQVTGFLPEPHLHSGLTRMLYRGASRLTGYTSATELWDRALLALRGERAEKSLFFLYWGSVDAVAHHYGAAGGQWLAAVDEFTQAAESAFFSRLDARDREDTLFLLVADHGFVDAPLELARDADSDPALRRQLLIPFGGESRAAYLHTLERDVEAAREDLAAVLGPEYVVVRSEQALSAGLFGPGQPHPESRARMGDLVALPLGLNYLDRRGKAAKLRGRHGGLLPEEMLVPWLALRLDA